MNDFGTAIAGILLVLAAQFFFEPDKLGVEIAAIQSAIHPGRGCGHD